MALCILLRKIQRILHLLEFLEFASLQGFVFNKLSENSEGGYQTPAKFSAKWCVCAWNGRGLDIQTIVQVVSATVLKMG